MNEFTNKFNPFVCIAAIIIIVAAVTAAASIVINGNII
jgi:hypothetical protein